MMENDQNVKIPLSLLNRAIEVLEYFNISEYHPPFTMMYDDVLSDLRKKKQSIHLRKAYAKIIFAENEDARFDARMKYLQEKQSISDEH
jgi:hypothetical protein